MHALILEHSTIPMCETTQLETMLPYQIASGRPEAYMPQSKRRDVIDHGQFGFLTDKQIYKLDQTEMLKETFHKRKLEPFGPLMITSQKQNSRETENAQSK